jgi:hypothetical protein
VPLLRPTDALSAAISASGIDISTPDLVTFVENYLIHLESAPEQWLLHWWLAKYLRRHYLRIFSAWSSAESKSLDQIKSKLKICRFLGYAVRLVLFAGDADVAKEVLTIMALIVDESKGDIACKFYFTFAEAYYARRAMDSPDVCREKLSACRAILDDPQGATFTAYEKHQVGFEETSNCFQEDDWVMAKSSLMSLEADLVMAIAPEKAASIIEANRIYTSKPIPWEDIATTSHLMAPAIGDCHFLRSLIDRVSVGGFSQQAFVTSTVSINYCTRRLLVFGSPFCFSSCAAVCSHQIIWKSSPKNAIACSESCDAPVVVQGREF